jgi:hypothetical protein
MELWLPSLEFADSDPTNRRLSILKCIFTPRLESETMNPE